MVQQPTERPLSAAPVEPANPESTSEYLTWLPATCSAVSLRLFALDSAIIYCPGDQPGRETLQVTLPPCEHTPMVSNDNKSMWPCTQAYAGCYALTDEHWQTAHWFHSQVCCTSCSPCGFGKTLSLVHAGIQVHSAAIVHTHARQQNC